MGNHHSLQDRIKEWCENNGVPDYEYYYEHALVFKGNGIVSNFTSGSYNGTPKVLDVNFRTYKNECACKTFFICKPDPNMITMVGHLFFTNQFNVLQYVNMQLTPTYDGFKIHGILDGEEIFGKLSFFDAVIVDLFMPAKGRSIFAPLEFSSPHCFENDTGIPLQDHFFDAEML